MMNYPVIELKAIAAYRNIQYLQFKLPLVEYVNNAIKDAEFMDHAMDYTREVYERWFSNRGNDDYRILSRDVTPKPWTADTGRQSFSCHIASGYIAMQIKTRILCRLSLASALTMTGPDSQSHTIPTETSCPE